MKTVLLFFSSGVSLLELFLSLIGVDSLDFLEGTSIKLNKIFKLLQPK